MRLSNTKTNRNIFYMHQISGTCAGVCTCDCTHQMEKTVFPEREYWKLWNIIKYFIVTSKWHETLQEVHETLLNVMLHIKTPRFTFTQHPKYFKKLTILIWNPLDLKIYCPYFNEKLITIAPFTLPQGLHINIMINLKNQPNKTSQIFLKIIQFETVAIKKGIWCEKSIKISITGIHLSNTLILNSRLSFYDLWKYSWGFMGALWP